MSEHCTNLSSDRNLGDYWERQFARMALRFGRSFTAHQWGRNSSAIAYSYDGSLPKGERCVRWTLPDITVWSRPGEHHEIKHKAPTDSGCFGLEEYRLDALLWFARETGNNVFYTIHNHAMNGGRNKTDNHPDHWMTANVVSLADAPKNTADGFSWVNGQRQKVRIHYWSTSHWSRLVDLWRLFPMERVK